MTNETWTTFEVKGMTCGSCARHIREALGELTGVLGVDIKLAEKKVIVRHDVTDAPVNSLVSTLADAGYESHQINSGIERKN